MSFQKVTEDITYLKPKMKAVKVVEDLPSIEGARNATVQVKADGEFNQAKFSREHGTCILNRFGRKTTGLPCIIEFEQLLARTNIVEAELLGELYAVDDSGRMVTLPNLIHWLKGTGHKGKECRGKPCYGKSVEEMWQHIEIGFFDIVSVNGVACNLIYPRKFEQLEIWLEDGKLVQVLEWIEVSRNSQVSGFFQRKVVGEHWEGIILRVNGDTWKVKPNNGVDCAIMGVNKDNKGFEQGKAKSVMIALMNEDGSFVEIGNCSGVGENEASQLFGLVKSFKTGEDNLTVFVKPVVIATVEYIDSYPGTCNRVFRLENGQMREVGKQTLVRLKSPHIVGYRADKKACFSDIGLGQVGES